MKNAVSEAFVAALSALPAGSTVETYRGSRYIATKSVSNTGRSLKLVAHELGGQDYISLNLYALSKGPRLFPCEMSHKKVVDFVLNFQLKGESA